MAKDERPSENDWQALETLRDALRRRPHVAKDGEEALEQHRSLASDILRAAKLWARNSDSEGDAFVRFLVDFFPEGRNNESDARLLWTDWRTSLVKYRSPGPGVSVTHGQPHLHWQRSSDGQLLLNLEDMERDYEASVHAFIEALGADSDRRAIALDRVTRNPIRYEVRDVRIGDRATSASVTHTGTSMSVTWTGPVPPREPPDS
jgi:hypothetical protein